MIDVDPRISPDGRAFLEQCVRAGGIVAGAPVPPEFTEGWSIAPFVGRHLRAHHWSVRGEKTSRGYAVTAVCGISSAATANVPIFGCGNAPLCGQCDRVMLALMKRRGFGAIKFR